MAGFIGKMAPHRACVLVGGLVWGLIEFVALWRCRLAPRRSRGGASAAAHR